MAQNPATQALAQAQYIYPTTRWTRTPPHIDIHSLFTFQAIP